MRHPFSLTENKAPLNYFMQYISWKSCMHLTLLLGFIYNFTIQVVGTYEGKVACRYSSSWLSKHLQSTLQAESAFQRKSGRWSHTLKVWQPSWGGWYRSPKGTGRATTARPADAEHLLWKEMMAGFWAGEVTLGRDEGTGIAGADERPSGRGRGLSGEC